MTGIWMEGDDGWNLQNPHAFENEKALHDMVLATPELLPLSGSPRLTVIGREMLLSTGGRVDVLAVEPDGRPVLIEVKLKNNGESRRAVVAQALSYAAALHGQSYDDFEASISSACPRGLHEAVRTSVQDEAMVREAFAEATATHLRDGSFRVVIVLDESPAELVNLVGYLEAVTTGISIDLITISAYEIGGRRIAVPQRLDPERQPEPDSARPQRSKSTGVLVEGLDSFRAAVNETPSEYQAVLLKLADWSEPLGLLPGVTLQTYFGKGTLTLLPRFLPERAGLVSIYRWSDGRPMLQLWRSVFERRAPSSIPEIEELIGKQLGQPAAVHDIGDELLTALAAAYRLGAASTSA